MADSNNDYEVIRWLDWCASKGITRNTGYKLRKAGKGPRIVHVTDRAIGVTRKADREWTEAREQSESDSP